MASIPNSADMNNMSATSSKAFSFLIFPVLSDAKEKMQENINKTATIDANSSTRLLAVFSAIWRDVIIMRQNPSRFAAVFKICCDVLLGI